MLAELRIRDFAIIDALTLQFGGGFNVLTGETGAGKSIIVGALSVLVGERASTDLVRTGAERAVVEGVFDLRDRADLIAAFDGRGVDADGGTVVLKREIGATRTRAWANGTPVTASVLAELGRLLVNIHGQHDAQALLDAGAQRGILDAFARAEALVAAVRSAHERVAHLAREREQRDARRSAARTREDWLRHVAREIGDARLRAGEEAELADEHRRLSNAEELRRLANECVDLLDGEAGVLRALSGVRRALLSLQKIDPSVARFDELHSAAHYQLEDLSRELSAYAESAEGDPERLAAVEHRRDLVFRLSKKYGGSEAAALEQLENAQRELALLDDAATGTDTLDREFRLAQDQLREAAAALSAARRKAAGALAADVARVLPALGLAADGFSIDVRPLAEPGPDGAEEIEFTAALNVGHAARPLARIASGGELSRVMLAIKTIVAQLDHVPTLVFDEVDSGIGGAVALKVGEAIQRVAEHHQVFAITHLPQIAARAANHIVVSKDARGGITTAGTAAVAGDERVREIARMLGGDPESRTGQGHAQELLANASSVNSPTAARTRARKSGSR